MRVLALLVLAVLVPVVVWGITYVPRHDGRLGDCLLAVVLPTAGICVCLRLLLPASRQTGQMQEDGQDKSA
ncbi:MAG: hypothetical protein ACP5XB_12675 [Isosphaeraceae bacterium]